MTESQASLGPTPKQFVSCAPGQTVQFGFLVWKQFDLAAHKRKANCCRKTDPFQGPKLGSCLTLRNELSKEIHVLAKQEILLGKAFDFSLSCIGEGNGNPLQCSFLETPRDGGAWWAAIYGVAQSQTRLSDFTFTFHFHALEKEMATHSSVLDRARKHESYY